jgi:hypothetical protein
VAQARPKVGKALHGEFRLAEKIQMAQRHRHEWNMSIHAESTHRTRKSKMASNGKTKLALIALITAVIAGRARAEDLNITVSHGPPRYVPPSALIISPDLVPGTQPPTQDPVPQGRDAQRPEFAVGLRNKHSSNWVRPVGLLPERVPRDRTPAKPVPCADQGFTLPSVGSEGPTIGRAKVCDDQVWQRTSGGFDW